MDSRGILDAYKGETLGRGMLSSTDVLGAIIFLLSSMSQYVNGQILSSTMVLPCSSMIEISGSRSIFMCQQSLGLGSLGICSKYR